MDLNRDPMTLRVMEVDLLTPAIKQIRLAPTEPGTTLAGYAAGAHISIEVHPEGAGPQWRRYSLVNLTAGAASLENPREYVIAVRLDERGRGGSKFVHEKVQVGDVLRVLPPRNDFRLSTSVGTVVLVAGGIGVTPLATMAATLVARRQRVSMFFAGRNRESLAYVDPLSALLGDRLLLHVDEEAGQPPDLDSVIAGAGPDAHLYVCGPQLMLDAALAAARSRGWPTERVHFEMFSAPVGALPNRPFEVVLSRSGRKVRVEAEQSLLQALNQAGCDLLYDCERGECGVCRVNVIEGSIDHRDYVLTEREKAEGRLMHACVSRSLGDRLVLDL